MPKRIASHVRRQAVGYLALVVALSGTAYAANKVTGRDIGPVKQRDSGVVMVQPNSSVQRSASCKKGEVALGFGAGTVPSGGGGGTPARIAGLNMTRREVLATIFNDTDDPQNFVVNVSCLKK